MTGATVLRPGFLLLLLLAPLVCVAWRRWPPPLSSGRSRLSLVLRLALMGALVLSLADVRAYRQPRARGIVAVVDLSDSASASHADAAMAVTTLLRSKAPDDAFGVVTFGHDAQVEVPPSRRPVFAGFQTRPDGGYSNLADGLELAANLIPDGYARQIVLVSDGRQNVGDAHATVSALRARSVRVDVLPLGTRPESETVVLALEAPHELRAGQSFTATARLRSSGTAQGRLVLQFDGRELESRQVDLPPGVSAQPFALPPLEPGLHRLGVALDAEPDTYSQNDVAEAVVRVLGRPSVLLLEGSPGAGSNVTTGLVAAGMDVAMRRANDSPTDLTVLARYDAVVVVDAPAERFPDGALDAIATSVRDLGRGLVAIGGPHAYGPGGWKDTPLEEALPVRMELPKPRERPAVALALVMETMESPFGDGVALGAAEGAIDQLAPDDEVAVINASTTDRNGAPTGDPVYVISLTRPRDKPDLKQRIRKTELGDPPGYGRALSLAFDTVTASAAATKQVVIIGDGDAVGAIPDYDALFAQARATGITVSAVGVDTHSDAGFMDHMRNIADRGGGVFYRSATASEVPQILTEATRTALRPWFEQSPFFPHVTSSGDLLEGVPLDAFPELGGHVVTTPKASADVALSSPKRDPVLAAGQYGLGRSVAWTSDAAGRWTAALLRSPVSATLFGRMVVWSLPTGANDQLKIDAVPRGDGLELAVAGPDQGGDLEIEVVSPERGTSTELLRPAGSGRWQGQVPAGEIGTYVLHAVLRRAGAVVSQAEVSVPVPYSPEYLELGRDDGLLAALAKQSGKVLAGPAAAWSQPALPVSVTSPVFWLLLLFAVLLWPVDIALRRLTLSPARLMTAIRNERAGRRRARARAAAELPETLVRLRAGVEARRRGEQYRPVDEAPVPEKALAARLLQARRDRAVPDGEGRHEHEENSENQERGGAS